mmetsp:Transcript_15471/g.27369  ORF Transcript_15471/g.27369 Transcript_15471/m.27369 type:complete len:248 (-) Transcript_15471:594-1337(-)
MAVQIHRNAKCACRTQLVLHMQPPLPLDTPPSLYGQPLARRHPGLQHLERLATALHLLSHSNTLLWTGRHLCGRKCNTGVEAQRVRHRPPLPCKHIAQHLRVELRVAALEVLHRAGGNAQVARVEDVVLHAFRRHFYHIRITHRRELVQPVAVNHQRLLHVQAHQRLGHLPRHRGVVDTHEGVLGVRGVEHGPEEVEGGAYLEALAHRDDCLHGGMKARREHKRDACLLKTLRNLLRPKVYYHTQRL